MGFFEEFKTFISRGNVMDMAVGVVIGGAFKSIVDALVASIITPVVGALCKTEDIAALSVKVANIDIKYGAFISAVINFLIIAFVIFCVVKGMNAFQNKANSLLGNNTEPKEEPAPEPSNEEKLLTEIRDLLKKEN